MSNNITPSSIDYQNADAVTELFIRAADFCLTEQYRDKSIVRLPAKGLLVATGDLHDNPFNLDKIMQAVNPAKAGDRHVFLHELIHGENLINGMDFSYRMLCRVAELKCAFPDQVHLLLANHELSQMTGRGVSKGAGDSVELFKNALDYVFGAEAEDVENSINGFLRSWPLALVTESGIMCSHSLPAEFAMKTFDTTILKRNLSDADYAASTGSAYQMLWGRKHKPPHLDKLAELFEVTAFIVGHEHAENGYLPLGKQGLILNSDHERGVILPIDLSAEPNQEQWTWAVRPINSL